MRFSRKAVESFLLLVILFLGFVFPHSVVFGNGYPIAITQIRTLDMQGTPVPNFVRGQTLVVEVTLQSQVDPYGPVVPYLLIVEIFDSNNVVASIGFVTGTIAGGETKTSGAGYTIPIGAAIGTYTAQVFVWNGWPSQKGAEFEILASSAQVQFSVAAS